MKCHFKYLKKLILVFLLLIPVNVWGEHIHYKLHINIDPGTQNISGTAVLNSDNERRISLDVRQLKNLKVNGEVVQFPDENRLTLLLKGAEDTVITYETGKLDPGYNLLTNENIYLSQEWYPVPNMLVKYDFSVSLPGKFTAVSEAEAVVIKEDGPLKTFQFKFKYPLDVLHLSASTRYAVKQDRYKDITLVTYFFKEDASLSDTYLNYTKKYLSMYEKMLTPYPYKRFSIVESVFPIGHSMPTHTLLGKDVIKLPFIVETSLGHEILHQWFGNSVYVDYSHGSWAEGITTYLADQHYSKIQDKDRLYRKNILVNYNAYVGRKSTISVSEFINRNTREEKAIGYGKTAMFFHGLKKRFGEENFLAALRKFIHRNHFSQASWHDIQRAFEEITQKKLYSDFENMLIRKDIPHIDAKDGKLNVSMGQLNLKFKLLQKGTPFPIHIPVTIHTESGKKDHILFSKSETKEISIPIEEPPTRVVMDEDYDLMRHLNTNETPPVLADIMGCKEILVVMKSSQRAVYEPIITALGIYSLEYIKPEKVTFEILKENSILIAGNDSKIYQKLFGDKIKTDGNGVQLKVHKNPYNHEKRILTAFAINKGEANAVRHKISHYGLYTQLGFTHGKNMYKKIEKTENGIIVFEQPATPAIVPETKATLNSIIPGLYNKRIVYIGEHHDSYSHHINQLFIIKKLHEAGYKLGVGMEMFQEPYQEVINDFMAGEIDERTFLNRSGYFEKWRYDYNLYKPIIDYLKQQKIPMMALNIEGEINRKVARQGIDGLSFEEQKFVPQSLNFSHERYKNDLYQIFSMHKEQSELNDFNYFLQAQVLWDEKMADNAMKFLMDNPERKMVILAGNGHIRKNYGIPERLFRRIPETYTTIVQDEEIEDGIADFVLFTSRIEGKQSPLLGIHIKENQKNVEILKITENSPAHKAGLEIGDILVQIDDQVVTSIADLKYALFYKKTGDKMKVQLDRNGDFIDKNVILDTIIRHPKPNTMPISKKN